MATAAVVLAGCSTSGPNAAEVAGCKSFDHLTLPTTPLTHPGEGFGFALSFPAKSITDLLLSGNVDLIKDARTLQSGSGQGDGRVIQAIQAKCVQVGA